MGSPDSAFSTAKSADILRREGRCPSLRTHPRRSGRSESALRGAVPVPVAYCRSSERQSGTVGVGSPESAFSTAKSADILRREGRCPSLRTHPRRSGRSESALRGAVPVPVAYCRSSERQSGTVGVGSPDSAFSTAKSAIFSTAQGKCASFSERWSRSGV